MENNPYPQQPNQSQQYPPQAGQQQYNPHGQQPYGQPIPQKSNTWGIVLIVLGVCGAVFVVVVGILVALLLPAINAARQAAYRNVVRNQMKQVSLAMMNYNDMHKVYPSAVLLGPDGKTPYSWRVAILPLIERNDLYSKYKFDEPWDGPNNIKLLPLMPQEYSTPGGMGPPNTSMVLITGQGLAFDATPTKSGLKARAITDGMSKTFTFVHSNTSIPWTKPDDLPLNSLQINNLGEPNQPIFQAATFDGAIHNVSKEISPAELKKFLTSNGNEDVDPDQWGGR